MGILSEKISAVKFPKEVSKVALGFATVFPFLNGYSRSLANVTTSGYTVKSAVGRPGLND